MIKLQAKIFELNFLSKFSDLKSNFTLTLGYLNPPLNNRGQVLDKVTFSQSLRVLLSVFSLADKYLTYTGSHFLDFIFKPKYLEQNITSKIVIRSLFRNERPSLVSRVLSLFLP